MRKHSWLKKSIASLLTLTLLLGAVPFTVFASEDITAEQIAAEQALEEQVFEIGGEKLTIEDLEQSAGVIVTDEAGQAFIIPGVEIREYILNNTDADVDFDGTINFKITRYTSMHGYITTSVTSNRSSIIRVEGQLYCRSTEDTYYHRNPTSGTTTLWSGNSNSFSFTSATFTLPSLVNYYVGINNLKITFYGGSTYTDNIEEYLGTI